MVTPLDAEKITEYIAKARNFRDLQFSIQMHRELLRFEKEKKLPTSDETGEKDE